MAAEKVLFLGGVAFGALLSVTGNYLVTAHYRWIDKNPRGFNRSTFALASLLFFGTIIWFYLVIAS
jgi:uncharacterized BrkB/YihY/UPF0761 family membrane protein